MIHRVAAACAASLFALCSAVASYADEPFLDATVDVVILGEFHDNPDHHAYQAEVVGEIDPAAVVYEMLTVEEAAELSGIDRKADAMRSASQSFHWSNIADYADVLAASSVIVGAAVPRDDVRAAFSEGAAGVFGDGAAVFGLTRDLPEEEQALRETLQFDAHCEAMPREMMSGLVEAQRLRDAAFARKVIDALDQHGKPIVLITGNGHAREDWGVPAYLKRARPGLRIASLGQGENGVAPAGQFTATRNAAPSPAREDPCAAFERS